MAVVSYKSNILFSTILYYNILFFTHLLLTYYSPIHTTKNHIEEQNKKEKIKKEKASTIHTCFSFKIFIGGTYHCKQQTTMVNTIITQPTTLCVITKR